MLVAGRQRFHQRLRGVYVDLILCRRDDRLVRAVRGPYTGAWSITVHAPDLLSRFGQRVHIDETINTDLNEVVRIAWFDPELSMADASALRDLAKLYANRLQNNRRPLRPPVLRDLTGRAGRG